jgi:hypothetical protein
MVQPLGSHLMPQQNCCMKKTIDLIRWTVCHLLGGLAQNFLR